MSIKRFTDRNIEFLTQSTLSDKVYIANKSLIDGCGVFACKKIAKGEVVFVKGGHILTRSQMFSLAKIDSYWPIDDNYVLAAKNEEEFPLVKLYINHSCAPNCGIRGDRPIVKEGKFTFEYLVEGTNISNISAVYIEIVSGNSSFVDYMLIRQENKPADHSLDNVLMAVEETKTSDAESRNTGIYQRASKFVYIDQYCPTAKKYMLYNEEMIPDTDREPTDTNKFGTNMLLTLGVTFIGKTMRGFSAFSSVDEMIALKRKMRLPNSTNVPILISKIDTDTITISGRLEKPKGKGNIGHDPNIGALSCIGYTLRKLGWTKKLIVTRHGVSQAYVDKTQGKNKCLFLFGTMDMRLDGIQMPGKTEMPEFYWNYSCTSEKVASIFLHLTCQYSGIHGIYENHAGCERGYFRTANGKLLALPKKDRRGDNLLLPDVVLCDDNKQEIYNVEGKLLATMQKGIEEIETYDSIELEYIYPHYCGYKIQRWVSIFGGGLHYVPHEKVLIYVNQYGEVYINKAAPTNIKAAFNKIGIRC